MNDYGTLFDWNSDLPVRPATKDELYDSEANRSDGGQGIIWIDGNPFYVVYSEMS